VDGNDGIGQVNPPWHDPRAILRLLDAAGVWPITFIRSGRSLPCLEGATPTRTSVIDLSAVQNMLLAAERSVSVRH
jgi:hypothetical protein